MNNDCQQVRYDESQWTLGKSQRSLDDPQGRFEKSQRSLDDPQRELEKSRRDNDAPQSENEGLGTPGATMGFKVYVVLNTSNEKGSNTVTITNA